MLETLVGLVVFAAVFAVWKAVAWLLYPKFIDDRFWAHVTAFGVIGISAWLLAIAPDIGEWLLTALGVRG